LDYLKIPAKQGETVEERKSGGAAQENAKRQFGLKVHFAK
jgi:hypothetical protein